MNLQILITEALALSNTKFAVSITASQERFPTFYLPPKLNKRRYKSRFIANSSSCTTTSLSKVFLSYCYQNYWIKCCEKLTKGKECLVFKELY